MKKSTRLSLLVLAGILSFSRVQAQFSDLMQKAKDKAAQKASELLEKKTAARRKDSLAASTDSKLVAGSSGRSVIHSGSDFIPGDSVLVVEDFSSIPVGSSPHTIKTNGSGTVVTLDNQKGKWLALETNATYRLSRQHFFPLHFTLEFDLLVSADKIRDMYPVTFGFTKDNSVSGYLSSAGEYISLLYYNSNDVTAANEYGKSLFTKFDLDPYVNRIMHVSMDINGEKMAVYLDKNKVVDTQMFLRTDTKNFYISAPMQFNNGSRLLFSNLKVSTFKRSI